MGYTFKGPAAEPSATPRHIHITPLSLPLSIYIDPSLSRLLILLALNHFISALPIHFPIASVPIHPPSDRHFPRIMISFLRLVKGMPC